MGDLDDLRKEMKGLQEAFNSLKKDHGELRDELRLRQKGTALPIDTLSIGKAKQASPLAFPMSHGPPGAHEGQPLMADVESSPQPQQFAPVEDTGFLEILMDTCGFIGEKKAAIADGPSATSAETIPEAHGAHSALRKQRQSLPAVPSNSEPDTGIGLAAASSSSPTPLQTHNFEGGGSSSSMSAARGTASSRGLSPHDRERPMEGNDGSARRTGGTPRSGTSESNLPGFGWSREQHPREHLPIDAAELDSLSLAGFGTSARASSNAFSTLRSTLPVASPLGLESQGGSAQRPTWRSPQAGQAWHKGLLPFPDLEDEENDPMSPGAIVAAAAATAPAAFFGAPPAGTLSWHGATAPAAQQSNNSV